MRLIGPVATALLSCFCSVLLNAQEVKYVDLSAISQRTELRHPPVLPSKCEGNGPCVGGGSGGGSVACGAPDRRDPHALGVYLLSVYPKEIKAAETPEIEFKLLNTGFAPIELPVSPHLSDLQPSDDSAPFTYASLALVVRVEGEHPSCVPCLAYVQLYGKNDKEGTTVLLRPSEWIRVKARVTFQGRLTGAAQLRGEFG